MENTSKTGFKLIGLKLDHKTTNAGGQSGIDCGNMWQKFEKENYESRIPNKLSDEIYAVYYEYEGDHTQPYSYFIGCKVNMETDTPQGMESLVIPSGSFTKINAKGKMPDCVANAWINIWNSKMERAYKYDFEIYDERSKDWSDVEVEIFISNN